MFDKERADHAIKFIELLKHTKGKWAGHRFILEPWQKEIVRNLFGTLNPNGARQYRTAYIEIPRKNGKTELAAAIALYLLFADKEMGAEIYSAAADRDQASLVFHVAADMIRQEPRLLERCRILDSTKRVIVPSTNSFYRVLSADAYTKHGLNTHGVIFDELHAQPNRDLWDVLTTGGGTRTQPLVFAITTAGYDRNSICWEQHDYAEKILKGIIKDPTFYAVIYRADEDDDWTDEKVWHKANPALGIFRSLDEMSSLFEKAQNVPSLQNTFRRLYLNQWTAQETRWLDMKYWDQCSYAVDQDYLKGRECYAGLDLASTTDIAAFVMVFRDNEIFYVMPRFWIPQEDMIERSRRDRVPYEAWVQEGLIIATEGNVIDYAGIEKEIEALGEIYNIKEIAYDRWGAVQISQDLSAMGFTVVPFGQGYKSMSPPTKELLKLVMSRRVQHGGNPVLRWMADNMIVDTDPAGNVKPNKAKSTEKIDGMVALIMGLDRAIRHEGAEVKSIYEGRGVLSI